MRLRPTHRNENFFLVILSERTESKDPYSVYSLSPGRFFDAATNVARSRRACPTAAEGPLSFRARPLGCTCDDSCL